MLKNILIGFVVLELFFVLSFGILVYTRYGDLSQTPSRVGLLYDMKNGYEASHGLNQELCGALFMMTARTVEAEQASAELHETFTKIYHNNPESYLRVNELCPFDGSDEGRIGCQLLRYIQGK